MKKLFTMFAFVTIVTSIMAQQMHNGHEYVDLGLPSGTLWATCNVGAYTPAEYGNYFAWGETVPHQPNADGDIIYSWNTYKWYNGSYMTKYCTHDSWGATKDNKRTLEAIDDAATVNWGGSWRMPTDTEQRELVNECTWFATTLNGVNGARITGKNGNSIFLPLAGCYAEFTLEKHFAGAGVYGRYWTSSLEEYDDSRDAHIIHFFWDASPASGSTEKRYYGLPIRPVCSGLNGKPTSIEQIVANTAESARKVIENGQVIIIRDGVRYNALGVRIK